MKTCSPQSAEELALRAFQHMAGDAELIDAFLAASGLQPAALRDAAGQPGFMLSVIDFICENDQRVVQIAQALGVRPAEISAAHIRLSGPGSHGWNVD